METAERHGVCPECEGYGGRDDDDECQQDGSPCPGSCPKCWCPGCHDGAVVSSEAAALDPSERMGSWAAYRAVQDFGAPPDQLTIEAEGAVAATPSSPDLPPSEERTQSDAWEPTSP